MEKNWHVLSSDNVLTTLNATRRGLSAVEVKLRLQKYGRNELPKEKGPSNLKIFLSQFNNILVYILIVAGLLTFFLHERLDSFVIFLAVFINAIFGYWEEHKTMKIMEKLSSAIGTTATVYREGQKLEIPQPELVPGDIIEINAGDKVAADARLIHVDNLKVSEAALTGESIPISKITEELDEETDLGDRKNMVYMGTLVESGVGLAVVVGTGANTETGKIVKLISLSKEEPSPLQVKVANFGKQITFFIAGAATLIFIVGLIRGDGAVATFEAAVAIAVGGIPESLPIVMTIVLVIGMDRILAKKGLIRKLSAVETLGSTNVICFDKTKTLTEGKMQVTEIVGKDEKDIISVAALASEAYVENPKENINNWKVNGSSTGRAIVLSAAHKGLVKSGLNRSQPELSRLPFNSSNKFMLSLREVEEETFIYALGAPDRLLDRAKNQDDWKDQYHVLMAEGLRVVGVAKKKVGTNITDSSQLLEQAEELEFIGLIGLIDPLRAGIKESIALTHSAGVTPVIITGDHRLTAATIARNAGIDLDDSEIMEGRELDEMTIDELRGVIYKIKLYARAEPKHKMMIVDAFQKSGNVVAMVGDGVNDAPAIKEADIGVAIGSGTEVAKETSDLILLNDSFSIIVKTIKEGRVILDNLRKSVAYLLSDSFSSMIIVGISHILLGWPIPILPVQILWNNVVEDTLPSIAYAFEPEEDDVMERKPEPKNTTLLTKQMKIMIFVAGLIDEFLILGLFWYLYFYLGLELDYSRTMIFGAMSIDTAFVIFGYKNLKKNIWNINLLNNKILIVAAVVVFVTFAMAVYVPFFQNILHTVSLNSIDWLILIITGIVSLAIVEASKFVFIKINKKAMYA